MQPLPVDDHVREIERLLAEHRRLVVTAPPGSGKSTRIPPALVGAGRVILLQPRRVAARALARRIAFERGWSVGREVGWQIRFESRLVRETKLVVATEGVLVRKLIGDPLLSDTRTVILDEFH
jgi:ATP-dependent helicase HrpB